MPIKPTDYERIAPNNIWFTPESVRDPSQALPVAFWSKYNKPTSRQTRLKVAQKLADGESLSYALSSSSSPIPKPVKKRPRDYHIEDFKYAKLNLSTVDLKVYRGVVDNQINGSNLIESMERLEVNETGDADSILLEQVPSIDELDRAMKLVRSRRLIRQPKAEKYRIQGGKGKITELLLGASTGTDFKNENSHDSKVSWDDKAKTEAQKKATSGTSKLPGIKKLAVKKNQGDPKEEENNSAKPKKPTPILKTITRKLSSSASSPAAKLKRSKNAKKVEVKSDDQSAASEKVNKGTDRGEPTKSKAKKKIARISGLIAKGKQ